MVVIDFALGPRSFKLRLCTHEMLSEEDITFTNLYQKLTDDTTFMTMNKENGQKFNE